MREPGSLTSEGKAPRPYSQPVDAEQERYRVMPVVEQLAQRLTCPISIDTSKASIAEEAVSAGAQIINDVTGLEGDPRMIEVAKNSNAGICAMQCKAIRKRCKTIPRTSMLSKRSFSIWNFARRTSCTVVLTAIESVLIRESDLESRTSTTSNCYGVPNASATLNVPILIGHSRKGFVGKIVGDDLTLRDIGTIGVSLAMAAKGMHVLRVHNVSWTVAATPVSIVRLYVAWSEMSDSLHIT
ncbi:MAG: dihydropteroate synthase [Pirellulaceae bacterium]